MGVQEARHFFLERIKKRLADEGRPLDGFELRYRRALAPKEESEVQTLWKDKTLHKSLDAAEKKFEAALHAAIRQDLMVNPEARTQYLKALGEIKSLDDGLQLEALVFAAATKFSELTPFAPWLLWVAAATLAVLGIGFWIGMHLRK